MAQHFDVAVVGMQTSGVLTAALLAKRGRRVLLVDNGESTTTYRQHGLCLPLVPELSPTIELSPFVQRVHEELGLGPELRAVARPLEPAFQAVMPKHRIDIDSRRDVLLAELKHEFPSLVVPVENFFSRLFALDDELSAFLVNAPPLPPNTWLQRLRHQPALRRVAHFNEPFLKADFLRDIPEDHPVRAMLMGPLTFFGHLWAEQPSTFHAVRLIARYFRGVSTYGDGLGGLPRLLLNAAERAGVSIRRGAMVCDVRVRRRRVTELNLEDDKQAYTADYFVANTVAPFHQLLPANDVHPRFVMEEQAVSATGSLLVVNLVIKKQVVPEGMAGTLFLLNGRRAERDDAPLDPPLFVQRFAARRGELGAVRGRLPLEDTEHEVMSVACPVRVQEILHSPARMSALKAQIIGRMRRVVPFLDDFLVATSLPVDTGAWDPESDVKKRIDPWHLHPIYEPGKKSLLLGIAARSVLTYYKNLVHCGRDVVPGLGLEGEYITAVNASRALADMAGRSWTTPVPRP